MLHYGVQQVAALIKTRCWEEGELVERLFRASNEMHIQLIESVAQSMGQRLKEAVAHQN
jgi:hypothetical protein